MIYLDWAATAPLSQASHDAMEPFFEPGNMGLFMGGANANALYRLGRGAFRQLEAARKTVAECLEASRPSEIVFTSGATEADNAALFGLVDAAMLNAQARGDDHCVPQVVVSAIEHDAVLQAAHTLHQWGARIVYVYPDKAGVIRPEALAEVMNDDTVLVSVMAVNNEVGSVMDIPALCDIAHSYGALFHTDATQAIGKIPVSVAKWAVDALSLSAHKIGGPFGVGALYIKARTPFSAQIVGGGQESGLRSGTQNVVGAIGLAAAFRESLHHFDEKVKYLVQLRNECYKKLCAHPLVEPSIDLTLLEQCYAPHIVNITVRGIESETLILRLDNEGFCVSGGSACSSHSLDPSHVLLAMGMTKDRALTSLRLSLGDTTTKDNIDAFVAAFSRVVEGI